MDTHLNRKRNDRTPYLMETVLTYQLATDMQPASLGVHTRLLRESEATLAAAEAAVRSYGRQNNSLEAILLPQSGKTWLLPSPDCVVHIAS